MPAHHRFASPVRRSLLGSLTAVALFSLAACGGDGSSSAAETGTVTDGTCSLDEPVKVGAVFSQTGPIAAYGKSQTEGITLAVDQFNEEGEVTYDLDVQDDTSQAAVGITVFKKLVDSGVVGIIGPTTSTVAFAADPPTNAAKVNVISPSNTAAGIAEIGDYVFRVALPEVAQIPAAVKAAKTADGIEKVAVIYDQNDAATKAGHDLFLQAFEDEGIEVVTDQAYASGDVDFSAQLTAIKGSGADALAIAALAEEGGPIISQARQMGIDIPLIGNNGLNSPALIKIAGDAAEGLILGSAWSPELDTEENKAFIAAYQEAYDAQPDQFAAQAYTAMLTLRTAVEQACSSDPTKVQEALAETKDLASPLGTFSFDEVGDIEQEALVLTIQGGKFVVLK